MKPIKKLFQIIRESFKCMGGSGLITALTLSIKVRFLSIGFILLLVSSVFSVWFVTRHEEKALKAQLDDKIENRAETFAMNSIYGVLTSNREELMRLAKNISYQHEIISVAVKDKRGMVLAEVKKQEGYLLSKEFRAPIISEKASDREEDMILGPQENAAKEKIGEVVIVVSLLPLQKQIRELRMPIIILMAIIIIILSFSIILVVNKYIASPIDRLIAATKKIAMGDLNYRVQVESRDELGALAQFFNTMTKDLSASLVSKDYVSNIFTSMIDILIVVDMGAVITTVNQATVDLLGYKEEELVGKKIGELLSAGEILSVSDLQLLSGKSINIVKNIEAAFKTKAGRQSFALFSISALKDRQGKVIGFVYAARDISERKKVQTALQGSEARYRLVAENASDVIMSFDAGGGLTYVSPSVISLTGYTAEEVVNLTLEKVFPKEQYETVMAMIKIMLSGRSDADTLELEIPKKDGAIVWTESKVTPIRNARKEIVGILCVTRDVSERKELEKQLFQFQKMEAIGRLAGGIAHDFNNLLTPIMGFAELSLRDLENKDNLAANLQEIKSASKRAQSLVSQLLAFSRKQILQPKIININESIKKMEELLRRLIGEDIELITKVKADVGNMRIDQTQMEQIIINLSANARDAMPSGGKLTIETDNIYLGEQHALKNIGIQPGNYVMLKMSDTGTGMDEETKAHIFEPFFSTKKEKGTGLGLATVYGIVKQSGGSISVSTLPGKGSSFILYFPQVAEQTSLADARPKQTKTLIGKETVLVVEDEQMVRNVIRQMLKSYGYTVIEAANGEEAVRLVQQEQDAIDIVVTDVVMPGGLTGRAVGEYVKGLNKNIKVLFISGYAESAIVHQGVLDSTISFIQKPFDPKTLVSKVRELLDTA